jgi:hypothetical protein
MSRPTSPLRLVFGLSLLLALAPASLPVSAAGFHAAAPAQSFWSALWESLVTAACGANGCPSLFTTAAAPACPSGSSPGHDGQCVPREPIRASGCDKGPAIDPNGGCAP